MQEGKWLDHLFVMFCVYLVCSNQFQNLFQNVYLRHQMCLIVITVVKKAKCQLLPYIHLSMVV